MTAQRDENRGNPQDENPAEPEQPVVTRYAPYTYEQITLLEKNQTLDPVHHRLIATVRDMQQAANAEALLRAGSITMTEMAADVTAFDVAEASGEPVYMSIQLPGGIMAQIEVAPGKTDPNANNYEARADREFAAEEAAYNASKPEPAADMSNYHPAALEQMDVYDRKYASQEWDYTKGPRPAQVDRFMADLELEIEPDPDQEPAGNAELFSGYLKRHKPWELVDHMKRGITAFTCPCQGCAQDRENRKIAQAVEKMGTQNPPVPPPLAIEAEPTVAMRLQALEGDAQAKAREIGGLREDNTRHFQAEQHIAERLNEVAEVVNAHTNNVTLLVGRTEALEEQSRNLMLAAQTQAAKIDALGIDQGHIGKHDEQIKALYGMAEILTHHANRGLEGEARSELASYLEDLQNAR